MSLLEETLQKIVPQDREYRKKAADYIHTLTMPDWALGRVLDLAVDLCGMTRTMELQVKRKRVMLFAGDHGIVEEGVTPSPQAVTVEMIRNFMHGGAAVNVLSRTLGAEITVVDAGVNADLSAEVKTGFVQDRKVGYGTKNFTKGPAMTREQAVQSVEAGINAVLEHKDDTDVFATGEMGIGNTTPSSAITAVLAGRDPREVVGCGAGIPESKLAMKAEVIRKGLELNKPNQKDGLDLLAKVGGFEIGAIAGAILGAASLKKPVIVDGFISTAGALIAQSLSPESVQYMVPAHGSVEPGHVVMMQLLGLKPLLDLNMRLGEGTGAVLAMPIVDSATAILREMATFESAGVHA